jgi:uroporphyrinogen decarboxylase
MAGLTTHERMTLVYEHREPDCVPITDSPWDSTICRWHLEGLPREITWQEHLGVDRIIVLVEDSEIVDTSPRFEPRVIDETDSYRVEQDVWGKTKMSFKPIRATPKHIASAVHDRETWAAAKRRMVPTRDRVNWGRLGTEWGRWRSEGSWISVGPWFGYDIVNARMVDPETILFALADDPSWVRDMCETTCDLALALLDMVWAEGYHFDELVWFDDMAYRNGLFFSKTMWREVMRPYQKRAVEWAHQHGIPAHLHSDGNIAPLLSDLVDLGIDMLDPLETRAGMDPLRVKREYGAQLALRGGFNILSWRDSRTAERDIRHALPILMADGGYVFSSDADSVSDDVSLSSYRHIVATVREVGKYR